MVSNLWKNTTLLCGNHSDEKVEMALNPNGKIISYCCPLCKNKITVNDFEKITNEISKIYIKRLQSEDWGLLTGEKFVVSKVIKCHVIEHTRDDKYSISVVNPQAGR